MILHGFVSDIRGRNSVRGSRRVDPADPRKSGEDLAAELRSRGASSLLLELRTTETVIAPQPE